VTEDPRTRDTERLAALLRGHITTQLIAAAVRLGIPDHLADGERTDGQLAELTGIALPVLQRYLRALLGLELVAPAGPGRYRLAPLGELLRRDLGVLGGQAMMAGDDYYLAWRDLDHALRTGESAFEHRHGCSVWDRLARDPEIAAGFTRTMRCNTGHVLDEILGLYEFPATGVVADLGAGDGTLLAGLLRRFPGLRGIALEQPAVIDHVRRTLDDHGVAARCEVVAGSFLDRVPAGADLYVLKSVIHNWSDDHALRILGNVRAALGDRGRLLVIERAASDAGDPLQIAVRDLTMLVLFGSKDRTAGEYAALVERAGLNVRRTKAGRSQLCLVEATRVA